MQQRRGTDERARLFLVRRIPRSQYKTEDDESRQSRVLECSGGSEGQLWPLDRHKKRRSQMFLLSRRSHPTEWNPSRSPLEDVNHCSSAFSLQFLLACREVQLRNVVSSNSMGSNSPSWNFTSSCRSRTVHRTNSLVNTGTLCKET